MKKPYSEWTNREHETMLRMKKEGFPVREIAETIGRSFYSVASRLQQRKVYRRVAEKPAEIKPIRRIIIDKAEVPDFYELGWRFAGFEDGQCVFEMGAR